MFIKTRVILLKFIRSTEPRDKLLKNNNSNNNCLLVSLLLMLLLLLYFLYFPDEGLNPGLLWKVPFFSHIRGKCWKVW